MSEFYSGDKLLNTLDKNDQKPELFIVCSRVRGPGKTYYFTKKLLTDYMKDKKDKFVLFCRSKLELGGVASGMFKSMMNDHFAEYDMYEKIQMKGVYSNIYIRGGKDEDEKEIYHVGYVIPLNSADNVKRISSMFSDAVQGFFDEFQPEDKNTYLSNEVGKFLSIHTSIARGNGQSRRYFPVYFGSNTVSINNPYFIALGLNKKIQPNTHFYRGDGFVFERTEIKRLVEEHAETGMARAFASEKAINFGDNSWLNDNYACVEKIGNWGRGDYICTLISGDIKLGIKYYPQVMLYYVDYNVDKSSTLVYNIKYDDMKPNIPLIKGSLTMIKLRESMERGIVRFKDLRCKNICMELFI